jgi:hypothetical protein
LRAVSLRSDGGFCATPGATRLRCGRLADSGVPFRERTRRDWRNGGDDASVDAATAEKITRYLTENAGDTGGQRYGRKLLKGISPENAPLRITELPRWVREHREVSAAEWKKKEVGSKANCTACHADAERGYYEDD